MDGWTEFDMVRVENELKEARLYKDAMLPKPVKHWPIRSTLARTLMTLAHHLSSEHVPAAPSRNLAASAEA